ncbi:hypothetical protein ACVOMT_12055 [Sphingomonas panni]
MDEFGPRLPLALVIAVGVALLALLLGAGINASAVVLVGAVAAVLVAGLHPPNAAAANRPIPRASTSSARRRRRSMRSTNRSW